MQKILTIVIIAFFITINFFSAVGKDQTQIDSYDRKHSMESYENYGFGYRLYNPDSQYNPGPVFFKLDEPEKVYTLAYDNNTITGGCYDSSTYTWYVCDDSGNIWIIDIGSGDMTLIGGNSESLSALAFDPQTDTMYGAYEDFLYGIDIQTGEILWTWSVAGPTMGYVSGMAADGLGHLYIVDTFDHLYRLDIDTFLVSYIGPLLIDIEGADLEFDFNTEILYLSGYTTQGALYRVYTWFGDATLIGNYEGGARISGFIIPWNWPPYPPEPPQITGPHYGKTNTIYTFSIGPINDPDGDQFYAFWDWGDGNSSSWVGPFNSGASVNVSYAWSKPGNYTIKVKIKDIHGIESDWSDPFFIVIVQLKPAFFLGSFESFNQTEDLFIIEGQTFIVFPSLSIFHKGKTIVISKGFLGHLGTSFILGVGGTAIL